jgi:type I restriction enzyme R subunit
VTGILRGFNYKSFFKAAPKDKMAIIASAMDYILAQKDGKERFVKYTTELLWAFALSVPNEEALKIRDDVGFFQAVNSQLIKSTVTPGKTQEELDTAIRQIVSKAIVSDKVVDIFDSLRKSRTFNSIGRVP